MKKKNKNNDLDLLSALFVPLRTNNKSPQDFEILQIFRLSAFFDYLPRDTRITTSKKRECLVY
jgi:hypothetical protein